LLATLSERRLFDIVKQQKIWGAAMSARRAGAPLFSAVYGFT
jgi:hypothetical protein